MNKCLMIPLASALSLLLASGVAHAQDASSGAMDPALESLVAPTTQAIPAPEDLQDQGRSEPAQGEMVFQPIPYQSMPSPLEPDDAGMRNDDLVRDIARYQTRESRIEAMIDLESAHLERERSRIQARLNLMEQHALLAAANRPPEEREREEAEQEAAEAEQAAAPVYVPPQPVVRSIYGHGDNSFAEIYIGATKIIATKGTVLSTGERVIDITSSGVAVTKDGRRQVLRVAGSAGIQAAPSPVSR